MQNLTNATLVTYNAKTAYTANAAHNARLMAGVKALTANGTKAVTLGHLVQYMAAQFNNPQFANYGLKMGKQPLIVAPKGMAAIVPTQKQLTPPA
jgi:hypothetical protein